MYPSQSMNVRDHQICVSSDVELFIRHYFPISPSNSKIELNRKSLRDKRFQKRPGKKPVIHSEFSPKFGVSTLNNQKIKSCFKWQKIKKKVKKYEKYRI